MPNRSGRPWRRVRGYVLDRDHRLCQLRYPGICTTRATQVDHIKDFATHPELELDPTNLRAVCTPCHTHRTLTDQAPHVPPSRSW